MQQYRDQVEEEQNQTNERLYRPEDENHRQTSVAKVKKGKGTEEADARFQDALTLADKKASALQTELTSVRRSLMDTKKELKIREQNMESLKSELRKTKDVELKLADKEASMNTLKEEIRSLTLKASEAITSKEKILEMEVELGKRKEVETSLYESLGTQTKQLEETKILLAESKLEIGSLRKKLDKLEGSFGQQNGSLDRKSTRKPMQNLNEQAKLRSVEDKSSSTRGHIVEKFLLSQSQTKGILEDMEVLKNELKLATEAEENSKKAMDDLALALKEVATETKQVKEKLTVSEVELEHTKEEAGRLRLMLTRTEDHCKDLVDEARKETDIYKNTAERLRLEAEESLVAWNEKERELVNCIKRIEEENAANQKEVDELLQSLATSENTIVTGKEENQKLRDILKQAINEANIAKEAAGITTAENSTLKDRLEERGQAVEVLTKEIDLLKINEAGYLENIKELQRMLSETSSKELKKEDKEKPKESKEAGKRNKSQTSFDHKEFKVMACGLHVKELRMPHKHKGGSVHVEHEPLPEIETDSALGGSIFDTIHSPCSDPDEFDHLEEIPLDDPKKKKALLRRVGDIIMMRRTFQR